MPSAIGLDLLLRDVVPCDEHGFIKRHRCLPLACLCPGPVWSASGMDGGHSRARCRRTRQGSGGVKHGSGGGAMGKWQGCALEPARRRRLLDLRPPGQACGQAPGDTL